MNRNTAEILARAEAASEALGVNDLMHLIAIPANSEEESALFAAAYRVKCRTIGRRVSIRALVEAGNVCAKDCFYCGIRKSNAKVSRYSLDADEIVAYARSAKAAGYASLVVQSGEIESAAHTAFVEDLLHRLAPLDMGITLSLGEQSDETYRRWRQAGAARYLLRIESSSRRIYNSLHPADHCWERRRDCLVALRELGYQVGTGVMCGLPGQTPCDLANDILFYRDIGAHMIGMGPWIPHADAPIGRNAVPRIDRPARLHLGLRMIAATRLFLHDINIAAATALQALAEDGREQGILAGANVIMPNVTDVKYRRAYQLYDGKPCLGEGADVCRACLDRRIKSIDEEILYNERGDSPRYLSEHGTP